MNIPTLKTFSPIENMHIFYAVWHILHWHTESIYITI